jgi:hypothetical protein
VVLLLVLVLIVNLWISGEQLPYSMETFSSSSIPLLPSLPIPPPGDDEMINIPLQLGDDSTKFICSDEIKQIFDTSNLNNNRLEGLGAGDSVLYTNFLSPDEANEIFHYLFQENEFKFQQWYRMPSKADSNKELIPLRRVKVAMATPNEDETIPHFRFPVNNQSAHGTLSPMTPIISNLCFRISRFLQLPSPLNHAVVLLYRDDEDCIGYHKDKPLDLDDHAPIATISLGFPRTYSLRDTIHKPTKQQTFLIPSGSLFTLGPQTNQQMYHSILPLDSIDNLSPLPLPLPNPPSSPSHDELPSARARISLTFRRVETFHDPATGQLKGKGAAYQTLNWPEELHGFHRLLDNGDGGTSSEDPAGGALLTMTSESTGER